jgi:outer membrane protein OmpA-like peptidoglycan-associated protein
VQSLRLVLPLLLIASSARADSTSGVDVALFRSSYDGEGIFALDGGRLMPKHDLSFKFMLGYAKSPLNVAIPGIGGVGDTANDSVLKYLVTIDMAFGMTITDMIAIGIDVAGYRTATDAGYGVRGHYSLNASTPSTGLIALRPLSNIDPSASPSDSTAYLGDGLAGPLDARAGVKIKLFDNHTMAVAALASVFLPFGEDQMLLGDRGIVFEPKLAFEMRADRIRATRVVANLAARIRKRTVLEGYDPNDTTSSMADPKAFLDVGSEIVAGVGGVYELTPRASFAAEGQVFVPLPDVLSYGTCRLYNGKPCDEVQYGSGAKHGDFTLLATAGVMLRVSADVTANLMVGTGQLGARGDEFRVTTGLTWAPQPAGAAIAGKNDRDGDGIPDNLDACPDEPEDKDGFQDEDGCPDPDNDRDGIPDAQDQCPNEPEDKDGFQDADGCPDLDNDKDGIPDGVDKCPNEPEDKDGFQDDDGCPDDDNDGDGIPDAVDKCPNEAGPPPDGCPDTRTSQGPEERADRIDLKGAQVSFGKNNAVLTQPAKQLLAQVAALIKSKRLSIRIEVHVPLGIKSNNAAQIAAQKKKDKTLATQRAQAILTYLTSQGVPQSQIQAVGLGSDRPLGGANATDPVNERVDFIKAQQGGATP